MNNVFEGIITLCDG